MPLGEAQEALASCPAGTQGDIRIVTVGRRSPTRTVSLSVSLSDVTVRMPEKRRRWKGARGAKEGRIIDTRPAGRTSSTTWQGQTVELPSQVPSRKSRSRPPSARVRLGDSLAAARNCQLLHIRVTPGKLRRCACRRALRTEWRTQWGIRLGDIHGRPGPGCLKSNSELVTGTISGA